LSHCSYFFHLAGGFWLRALPAADLSFLLDLGLLNTLLAADAAFGLVTLDAATFDLL